jgi:hypothetical protein
MSSKMQKRFLVLGVSAVILAWGDNAIAQQNPADPTMQQPGILQRQDLERQLQVQARSRGVEDDSDQEDNGLGRMRGWGYWPGGNPHLGWGYWPGGQAGQRGAMGPGMLGQGMGAGRSMGSGMMMRMIFTLMDSDGDGTLSLEEFQAAHARIFKGMDADKDGRLTMEEMQGFMQGSRRSVPRQ